MAEKKDIILVKRKGEIIYGRRNKGNEKNNKDI